MKEESSLENKAAAAKLGQKKYLDILLILALIQLGIDLIYGIGYKQLYLGQQPDKYQFGLSILSLLTIGYVILVKVKDRLGE